jgi:hypothetical protein
VGRVLLPLLSLCLTAAPLTVAVVDVSAADAIYEDVSRGLTQDVVAALNAAGGYAATRVDENDLPEGGCRAGPCLEKVAREKHADVVVLVDCVENDARINISVLALWGRDGRPLGGKRYVSGKKSKKALTAFITQLTKSIPPPPPNREARDAGR